MRILRQRVGPGHEEQRPYIWIIMSKAQTVGAFST